MSHKKEIEETNLITDAAKKLELDEQPKPTRDSIEFISNDNP